MQEILLLTPPFWHYFQPGLSVPTLQAFLKMNGIKSRQKDLNIESLHYLISESNLQIYIRRIRDEYTRLEKKLFLSESEKQFHTAAFISINNYQYVIHNLSRALEVYRHQEKYYQLKQLKWANSLLAKALQIVSTAFYPSKISMEELFFRYHIRHPQLHLFFNSTAENIFLTYYREKIVPFIKKTQPALIGISLAANEQALPGLTLAHVIKEHFPEIFVVAGGTFITSMLTKIEAEKQLYNFEIFDALVGFEGEQALFELYRQITSDQYQPELLPNLIYQKNGHITVNRPFTEQDINQLPTPDYDDLDLRLYLSPSPVLALTTTRACYWGKCTFCTSPFIDGSYRRRKAELVYRDLQTLVTKYGVRHFLFHDQALPPATLQKLAELILENNLEINWYGMMRFEKSLNSALCQKLARAGFRRFLFGLEAGSQRMLALMQKGTDLERARLILQNCREAKVSYHFFIIVGFPTETAEDSQQTLDFITKNAFQDQSVWTTIQVSPFNLEENTQVAKEPQKYGVTKIEIDERDLLTSYHYQYTNGRQIYDNYELAGKLQKKLATLNPQSHFLGLSWPSIFLYQTYYGYDYQPLPASTKKAFSPDTKPYISSDLIKGAPARHGPQSHYFYAPCTEKTLIRDPYLELIFRHSDGQTTIKQILAEANTDSEKISHYLNFLLDEGFLII